MELNGVPTISRVGWIEDYISQLVFLMFDSFNRLTREL